MNAIAAHDLVSHRSFLVRFAQRRLMDPVLAEDAVHDVFEAVLAGRAVFGGRAALRSWLTAVLKNKIVDIVRRRPLMDSLDAGDDDGDEPALQPESTDAGPEELAALRERLAITLARIDALPDSLRETVRLKLIEDQPSHEVCAALSISEDNLFVRLHRARKALAADGTPAAMPQKSPPKVPLTAPRRRAPVH
jgi:RNA polymerase sigma-70 factor (ECF subfamily)